MLESLNIDDLRPQLQAQFNAGIRSVAIVFMHAYRYQQHEALASDLARQIGFTQISTSHQTSPLMKFVSRGDTTVVDAYLSPILRRYVDQVAHEFGHPSGHEFVEKVHLNVVIFGHANGGACEDNGNQEITRNFLGPRC